MCSGVMLSSRAIYSKNRGIHYGGVCVVVEKQLDHRGVGSCTRHNEGSYAVAIHRDYVDVFVEKKTRDVQTVLTDRPVERRSDL